MYPLGTTLIFTELAEAAAAARLFGRGQLDSKYNDSPRWKIRFKPHHDKWRIVLNTKEKVKWFEPQVCDMVQTRLGHVGFVQAIKEHDTLEDAKMICVSSRNPYEDCCEFWIGSMNIERMVERNGKPFPTPQEVILPKEDI